MMFHMTSKVFQDIFLTNEKDQDILDAQYVLVSSRIRRRNANVENIISAYSMLFPSPNVCSALDDETLKEEYYDQLAGAKTFIATLIKGSIEEGYNIIFICTKKEGKIKFLDYLANYIYMEFGYPVYEYKKYASGALPLRKYDKEKVIKKCNKLLKRAKEENYKNQLQTVNGRKQISKSIKKMKKKELIKELDKKGLYVEGMDKTEMIEMLRTFL